MNDIGRRKVWDALLDNPECKGVGFTVEPLTYVNPDEQHDFVEIRVRPKDPFKTPTSVVLSALGHAGLLHIDNERTTSLLNGDQPQLELVRDGETDNSKVFGDRQLFFVDRTVPI